jgi:hypothetical protein
MPPCSAVALPVRVTVVLIVPAVLDPSMAVSSVALMS